MKVVEPEIENKRKKHMTKKRIEREQIRKQHDKDAKSHREVFLDVEGDNDE